MLWLADYVGTEMYFAQINSRRGFMIRIAGLILGLMLSLVLAQGAVQAQPKVGLFGSMEIPSRNMKSFGKWTEMWRRHNLPRTEDGVPEAAAEQHKCLGQYRVQCSREAWEKFVTEQDTSDPSELLKAVNLYMNRSPYILDPVNWGIPDYWATPDEFFLKDGDCEDYAISKYITLKRMGYDPNLMRLVILQDENLRVAHAVLAVQLDGTFYILDNQVDAVLPHNKILHYRPVYSINEAGWWLHRANRFPRK